MIQLFGSAPGPVIGTWLWTTMSNTSLLYKAQTGGPDWAILTELLISGFVAYNETYGHRNSIQLTLQEGTNTQSADLYHKYNWHYRRGQILSQLTYTTNTTDITGGNKYSVSWLIPQIQLTLQERTNTQSADLYHTYNWHYRMEQILSQLTYTTRTTDITGQGKYSVSWLIPHIQLTLQEGTNTQSADLYHTQLTLQEGTNTQSADLYHTYNWHYRREQILSQLTYTTHTTDIAGGDKYSVSWLRPHIQLTLQEGTNTQSADLDHTYNWHYRRGQILSQLTYTTHTTDITGGDKYSVSWLRPHIQLTLQEGTNTQSADLDHTYNWHYRRGQILSQLTYTTHTTDITGGNKYSVSWLRPHIQLTLQEVTNTQSADLYHTYNWHYRREQILS